jgi:hypothetical protein
MRMTCKPDGLGSADVTRSSRTDRLFSGCLSCIRGPGGERWELEETGDGTTLVTLRAWRQRAGLGGWLERLFASSDDAAGISLRKQLAYVQFRAERGSPRLA